MMADLNSKRIAALAVCLAGAVALSACTRSNPFSQTAALQQPTQPSSLTPAPLPPVSESQLTPATPSPAVPAPATTPAPTGDLQPSLDAVNPEPNDIASAATSSVSQAASAQPVTKNQALGNWQARSGSANCVAFLTLTKWGSGQRGGTRGCGSNALANVDSWDVKGKQVVLYDRGGSQVATLFRSSDKRFDGSLSTGQAVSLSRS